MGKRTRGTQKERVSDGTCSSFQQSDTPSRKKMKWPEVHADSSYFNKLPNELLTQIFGLLEVKDKGAVAKVCRSWRTVVYHPSFWSDANAQLHLNRLNDVSFGSLQTRGIRKVTVLDDCGANKVLHLVTTLSKAMPSIEELTLREVEVDNSVLLHVKQAFLKLEKLEVNLHCSVTLDGVQHLTEMTQLRGLHLHSPKCPAEWMQCLRGGLTELQVLGMDASSLDFDGLMSLTELPFLRDLRVQTVYLTWGQCKRLLEGCGNLIRFTLSLHEMKSEPNPPPRPLCRLPHLEEVCLKIGPGLKDEHILALCRSLPSLRKLAMKLSFSITNTSLRKVAQMPTLESLFVSLNHYLINRKGLRYLREGRAPLKDLSLRYLSNVKDSGITELQGLESLQRLHVYQCNVSDKALLDCVLKLPQLQVLEADISQESKQQLRTMRPGLTMRNPTDSPHP